MDELICVRKQGFENRSIAKGWEGCVDSSTKIAGGISCERNVLEYINMRMWVAGRVWKGINEEQVK